MSGIEKNPKEKTRTVLRSVVNTGDGAVQCGQRSDQAGLWRSDLHGTMAIPTSTTNQVRRSKDDGTAAAAYRTRCLHGVLSLHVKDTAATLKGRLLHCYKQVVA